MPRILRSQGIYKLFPPIIGAAPAAPFIAAPIQTRLVAVAAARKAVGRYPSEGYSPWVVQGDGILDTFNRANENLVASPNWFQPLDVADTATLTISGNQLSNPGAAFGSATWIKNRFGPDCSVFVQQGTVPNQFYLYARMNNVNTAQLTGYALQFDFNSTSVRFFRVDGTSYVDIGGGFTAISGGFTTGDVLTLKIVGSTLTAYKNGTRITSCVDATYGTAGYIGIDVNNGFNVDNFGGGTLLLGGRHQKPLVGIWPPMIIDEARPPGPPIRSSSVAGRDRRHPARKTIHVLRPPAVVGEFVAAAPTVRLTQTRPRRTTYVIRRPTTLRVFTGPKSWLTKARPRPTTHVFRPAAVVLVPHVEQQLRTLRVRLVRSRPTYRHWLLRPPQTLQTFAGPTKRTVTTRPRATEARLFPPAVVAAAQTYPGPRTALVRIRPPRTTTRLEPPTVVTAPAVFYGPTSRLTRIRPPHTTIRLSPPAVVAPRPLAPPPQSRLVRTRPRHTIYRLEAPTTLAVFSGPRSELTRVRPQPTTTVLVPAQVVRNPHVEQQLRTLRVRLVRTRPQPTTTLLRPPAVVITTPQVTKIRSALVRARPKAITRFIRPATLEPYSIQLREHTIRVQLVRIRPRRTTLKLRPPTRVAVLTFSTGKPVLVRSRPERTVTTLRGPVVLRVFSTGETRLVTTRPRHTTTVLRPPAVVRRPPEVTQIRAALVTARPRPTTRLLRPPAALRVFAGPAVRLTRVRPRHTIARLYAPTVVTPFVAPVLANIRAVLTRIRPPRTLAQLFPPRRLKNVPGAACLTDHAAFDSCLTDQAADVGCLTDAELEAQACLTDQAAYRACLVDMSAATATLRDEE